MENVPEEVLTFVTEHADFDFIRDHTKVKCIPTGQEFPCRMDVIKEYTNSKAFMKAKAGSKKVELNGDFSKYEPHITQHKKMKHALFCQLTGAALNKITSEIEKHINGKRFKRAKKEFEEMVNTGAEVTDDEEEEEEEEDELSELSGVDEIDFTASPKRRRIQDPDDVTEEPRKDDHKEVASTSEKKSTDEKSEGSKKSGEKTVEEKKRQGGKLNKKAKKRLAEQQATEKKEAGEPVVSDAAKKILEEPKQKKEKTAAQKRLVNSKKRHKNKKEVSNP